MRGHHTHTSYHAQQSIDLLSSLRLNESKLFFHSRKNNHCFQAAIKDIDTHSQTFTFYQIPWSENKNNVTIDNKYLVVCGYQGSCVKFNVTITNIHKHAIFIANFPEKIIKIQRRKAPRMQADDVTIIISKDNNKRKLGHIDNLSSSGFSARFEKNLTAQFKEDSLTKIFMINSRTEDAVLCQIKLTRLDYNESKDETIIAGFFHENSDTQVNELNQFILNSLFTR